MQEWGVGCRVWDIGCWMQDTEHEGGLGCEMQDWDVGFRIWDAGMGCRIQNMVQE